MLKHITLLHVRAQSLFVTGRSIAKQQTASMKSGKLPAITRAELVSTFGWLFLRRFPRERRRSECNVAIELLRFFRWTHLLPCHLRACNISFQRISQFSEYVPSSPSAMRSTSAGLTGPNPSTALSLSRILCSVYKMYFIAFFSTLILTLESRSGFSVIN